MAMVITDVAGNRSASWSFQGGRQHTQQLRIITDDPTIGPRAIMQSLGLKMGDTYKHPLVAAYTEFDQASYLQSVEVSEENSDGKSWIATISYGPFSLQEQAGASEDGKFDPFKVPPKVKWDDAKFETAALYDTKTGKPILNTVGDPFDPPLKKEETRPNLIVVKNEPAYDINWVQQFKDHVNSDVFLGFEPNTVKCASITADQEYQADFGYYYTVTYAFEVRPILYDDDGNQLTHGFTEKVLNAGFRQLKSGTPVPVIVSGSPVSNAVALTKAGAYDPTADPYYIEANIFPFAEMSKLGLPDDLLEKKSTEGFEGS